MSTPSSVVDFVIVQAEGKSYLGKPHETWLAELEGFAETSVGLICEPRCPILTLSPVYEYSLQLVNTPQGPAVQPQLRPPFGCMSIRRLAIPGARPWVAVADLSSDEQRVFEQLVAATDEAMNAARAQAAGVVLAPVGAKLPPFSGGPRR